MMLYTLIPDGCLMTLLMGGLLGALIGGVMTYFYVTKANSNPIVPIDDNLITNEVALAMINNFSGCTEDNTNSGHIELNVLLSYIDAMSTQCSIIGKELGGLEYYFAKYDEDDLDEEKQGRSTIVIYPTYKESHNYIPFDPFLSSINNTSTVSVVDLNKVAAGSRSGDQRFSSKNVLNRLHMSPPRQPTL